MRLGEWHLTLGATATSGALLGLLVARRAGAPVSSAAIVACALVAVPVALAAAVQRLVYVWRGPSIVSFSGAEAVRCGGADAEAVRAAAQLRGTLGGAGHVHRGRLLFHAVACFAAASLGIAALGSPGPDAIGGWPLAIVAGTGVGAVLLPARPFYYREAMHGEVVVSPAFARTLLAWPPSRAPAAREGTPVSDAAAGREAEPVRDGGEGAGEGGRGTSPNSRATASKPAGVEVRPEP